MKANGKIREVVVRSKEEVAKAAKLSLDGSRILITPQFRPQKPKKSGRDDLWPLGDTRIVLANVMKHDPSMPNAVPDEVMKVLKRIVPRSQKSIGARYRNMLRVLTKGRRGLPNFSDQDKKVALSYMRSRKKFVQDFARTR